MTFRIKVGTAGVRRWSARLANDSSTGAVSTVSPKQAVQDLALRFFFPKMTRRERAQQVDRLKLIEVTKNREYLAALENN